MSITRINIDEKGKIYYIILNSDDGRNALDLAAAKKLLHTLHEAERSNCKVVVIYSKSRAFFSSGYEFYELETESNQNDIIEAKKYIDVMNKIVLHIHNSSKLTIAAIHGAAFGTGLNFTLACDYRFAVKNAKLVEGFIGAGLVPDVGASYFLPRLCGPSNVYRRFINGEIIVANEAKQIGLVNEVFENKGEMHEKIVSLSSEIKNKNIIALKKSKELFEIGTYNCLEQQLVCEKKNLIEILEMAKEENYD